MDIAYNPYYLLVEVIIHDCSNFIFNKEGVKIGINENRILSQINNWFKKQNKILENEKIVEWIKKILFETESKDIKTFWDIEAQLYTEE